MFKKYNSLTNHTDKKFLNKVMLMGLTDPKVSWVAREKIHGANFSFIITQDSMTSAKRSGPIEASENFYSHADIESRYRDQCPILLQNLIQMKVATIDSVVQLFGEYAGDTSTGKKIQHGIEYGPAEFYAFDVMVDGKYLSDTALIFALMKTTFKVAPLIKIGTFDELINIRNDFDSIVEKWNNNFDSLVWNNMEHLQYTGENTAEGFVMRPIDVEFFGDSRVAIKHKNEKFSEKKNKVKNFVAPPDLTEKDNEVYAELQTYITENRVRNVLSKIGTPNTKQFGMVMGLTVKDLLEESENILDTSDNPSIIKKRIVAEVGNLIRPHWVNICNGDF